MPPTKQTYFELFGLPESFDVDGAALADSYRRLQSEAHPDRVAGQGEEARLRAVQLTSFYNEAHDTLRSPLKRAAYLLRLRDIDTEQVSQQDLGPELLLEQMQLRERLAELPEDDSALDELQRLRKETAEKIASREQSFREHLEASRLDEAKKLFHEMQFLQKLLQEIEAGEEKRLDY